MKGKTKTVLIVLIITTIFVSAMFLTYFESYNAGYSAGYKNGTTKGQNTQLIQANGEIEMRPGSSDFFSPPTAFNPYTQSGNYTVSLTAGISLWGVYMNGTTTQTEGDQFNFSIYYSYFGNQTLVNTTGWISQAMINLVASDFNTQKYTGISVEVQASTNNSGPVNVVFVFPLKVSITSS